MGYGNQRCKKEVGIMLKVKVLMMLTSSKF